MKITIGNLIDQLTIANLRIWMAEDVKRNASATDKQIADATRITNVVNQQRNDLIQAIDEELNQIASGEKQKTYKQGSTKMYDKENR
jgi:hypothetical protein